MSLIQIDKNKIKVYYTIHTWITDYFKSFDIKQICYITHETIVFLTHGNEIVYYDIHVFNISNIRKYKYNENIRKISFMRNCLILLISMNKVYQIQIK